MIYLSKNVDVGLLCRGQPLYTAYTESFDIVPLADYVAPGEFSSREFDMV